jgi:SNF2 family DNA or RNA helicase
VTLSASEAADLQRATGELLVRALDAQAIGFMEVTTAARIAAVVRNGGTLDTNSARQAWRILTRNEGRLMAAGLTMPSVPGQAAARVTAPVAQPAPPERRRPQVAMRADGRIGVLGSPYALKEALKSELHAQWDKVRKQWHIPPTPAYAAALATILGPHEPTFSARVAGLIAEYGAAAERRAVLDPDAPLPDFDTSPLVHGDLWEHQLRAVEYATNVSAACLAVPMSGGKTAAAIATANRTRTQRAVIVCPNKVRGVWPREIAKWSRADWHIVDGKRSSRRKGGRPVDLQVPDRLEQAEACLFDCACGAAVHAAVMNYEMLAHELVAYRGAESPGWVPPVLIDMVIYDEIQRLKSPTGIVSKTAEQWVAYFARRLGLSGTPMPQYPWDVFGVYRALDPGIFGPLWTPFKAEFVQQAKRKDGQGKEFPVRILKEKRAEFARKVHSIMYRPTIDLQLPGAHHVLRRVELEEKAQREYDRLDSDEMWADLSGFRQVTHEAAVDDDPILTPKNVLARTLRLRQFTGGFLPDDGEVVETDTGRTKTVRNVYRVSRAKADMLAEDLEEIGCVKDRDGGPEPVCVYAAFRGDLDAIREVVEKAGLRYREISGRRADGLTASSELAGDADVVGVQIQSGGTGVDLTRSCYGILYSVAYSAGDHDQMLKRQDRKGQTRKVTFIHYVATGTVDEDVYRSLASRRSMVATFMATRGVSPRLAGLEDDDAAPEMTLDEIENRFNTDRAAEGVEGDDARGGNAVRLPIDDFAADVFGDPRERKPAGRPAVSDEQLAEFDLEGFV